MAIMWPPSACGIPAFDANTFPAAVVAKLQELSHTSESPSAYIYYLTAATARATKLRAAIPSWMGVYYAVKANSFAPLISHLAGLVDGFDVASTGELKTVQNATNQVGTSPEICASGPGKSLDFLRSLLTTDKSIVNVDSISEIYRLSEMAEAIGVVQPIAIRVSPFKLYLDNDTIIENDGQRFGIPINEVNHAVAYVHNSRALDLRGFHFHLMSNNMDALLHAAYIRWCIMWSRRAAQRYSLDLKYLNIGGGIGVGFGLSPEFDMEVLRSELQDLEPPGFAVLMEPGRYLTADCGWYVSQVTDIKGTSEAVFVVIDGGIHQFQLPTSWGILHNALVIPTKRWHAPWPRPTVTNRIVTVVGKLCTTEDTLLRDVSVARVSVGDMIAFPYAGAYGWEFAMHDFLGHPHADRLVIEHEGKTRREGR